MTEDQNPNRPGDPRKVQPWASVGSKTIGDYRIFSIRSDYKISPITGEQHDFFVIDTTDWVNVIAVTPNNELVMIEQYRHGSNSIELEIPGGMVDDEDESPMSAGLRELREETGFEGDSPRLLGSILPNPAIMNNRSYTFLVKNCRHLHPVEFDYSEDLVTHLVPITEVPGLVISGRIKHSIVLNALYFFDLYQRTGITISS
ncbi:MAG: NUDIX hydrolase [Verrucomicrobia bacterium]|nr:NUDIX hydrolase [Verrucomicrobiota bacterium]MCF7708155.1 NUDIX hydrolase [Verrucomicrobiota bacterium]